MSVTGNILAIKMGNLKSGGVFAGVAALCEAKDEQAPSRGTRRHTSWARDAIRKAGLRRPGGLFYHRSGQGNNSGGLLKAAMPALRQAPGQETRLQE